MNHTDFRDSNLLLAQLDDEIERKCAELKELNYQNKLKKLFFSSCLFLIIAVIAQLFLNLFNVNLVFSLVIYQAIALALLIPMIPNFIKGGLSKWEN